MTQLSCRDSEFLIYQTEDGRTCAEVRFDRATAWLSLGQMAEVFRRDKGYRVKPHRGTQSQVWATAPRSRPRVRGPLPRRTGPRGAHR